MAYKQQTAKQNLTLQCPFRDAGHDASDKSQSQDLFKIRFKAIQSEKPEQQKGKYNFLAKC